MLISPNCPLPSIVVDNKVTIPINEISIDGINKYGSALILFVFLLSNFINTNDTSRKVEGEKYFYLYYSFFLNIFLIKAGLSRGSSNSSGCGIVSI